MHQCCSTLQATLANPRIDITRCTGCGTLWGTHSKPPDGRPWDESYVPEHFAKALRRRRERQAVGIAELLLRHARDGRVLDYGCGQGVFLATALAKGLDAYGCDLDLDAPHSVAPRDRLIRVEKPWGVPDGAWSSVVMLDVIEHHHDPVSFLRELPCQRVLLKVPNATGPAARMARTFARLGRTGLLEQLFLVGENFPHQWLATARGLERMARDAGFAIVARRALVEVGPELPDRMRETIRGPKRGVLAIAGTVLGALGSFWSDASVVLLERRAAS